MYVYIDTKLLKYNLRVYRSPEAVSRVHLETTVSGKEYVPRYLPMSMGRVWLCYRQDFHTELLTEMIISVPPE